MKGKETSMRIYNKVALMYIEEANRTGDMEYMYRGHEIAREGLGKARAYRQIERWKAIRIMKYTINEIYKNRKV